MRARVRKRILCLGQNCHIHTLAQRSWNKQKGVGVVKEAHLDQSSIFEYFADASARPQHKGLVNIQMLVQNKS